MRFESKYKYILVYFVYSFHLLYSVYQTLFIFVRSTGILELDAASESKGKY